VDLREGQTERVELALTELPPPPVPPAPAEPPPAPLTPMPPARDVAAPVAHAPAPADLSHGGHFGATARVDVDPLHKGLVEALGATFGIGGHFELAMAALLGSHVGMEPRPSSPRAMVRRMIILAGQRQ
jgi:hypothetical protein